MHTEFEDPDYTRLNVARGRWLEHILDALPFGDRLSTALDVACGHGYFAELLFERGLDLTCLDMRAENLEACRERFPDCVYRQINLDETFASPGVFDLVLIFGILYHLQAPLQAIRQLARSVGRLAVLSVRMAPGESMACYVYREKEGLAHNVAPLVLVPTLPALVAMLHAAGLTHVYKPKEQPRHEQWDLAAMPHCPRHSLVAAREPIGVDDWRLLEPPPALTKWQALP